MPLVQHSGGSLLTNSYNSDKDANMRTTGMVEKLRILFKVRQGKVLVFSYLTRTLCVLFRADGECTF